MKIQPFWWIIPISLFSCVNLSAKPFTPVNDEQVLEKLPISVFDSSFNEALRQQRARLNSNPSDLNLAVDLAWSYVKQGRVNADPRYYGYAQAVLKPWWQMQEPPPQVLLLRATLKQNRHDFKAALADLNQLLKLQPRNAQAWLTRAIVLTVTGDHNEALQSCMPLLKLTSQLLATTCISHTLSLKGQAQRALEILQNILAEPAPPVDSNEDRIWALTLTAEIAVRLGDNETAEKYFKKALTINRNDVYLLSAYADYLLDQQRYSDVVELLENQHRIDALLLRLTLAEKYLGLDVWQRHKADLITRVRAAKQRNDNTHLGDHARLHLQLLNAPEQALTMALANWQLQREPRDALIVLQAALAAKDLTSAETVIDWVQQVGLEDVRLSTLIFQLRRLVG